MEMRKTFLVCPWLPEDRHEKTSEISLEDPSGQVIATAVASHEPEVLGQFHMMACVRDVFDNPIPKREKQGLYSGPFKQWGRMDGMVFDALFGSFPALQLCRD